MEDIAIVGMACMFPGAPDLKTYWNNIVNKVDAISDPPDGWGAEKYFDPDHQSNDRLYCKKGGYLGDLARFDPLEFGIMPSSLDGGEPDHYLALKVAKDALSDAGYPERPLNSERVEVIVGRGTYINRGVTNSFQHTVVIDQTIDILKEIHPGIDSDTLREIKKRLKKSLPPFNAETVPNLVPNILTGRIANRLDFMGANYLVDAACASSLIAVEHGMNDLKTGKSDAAVVGGVNASLPHTMLVIFSQINALSRRQNLRPFDEMSDGTMLGEGLGFIVLKRKKDALQSGDRIYAILKSVGIASDGRALGPLSPRIEGEALAIVRAYAAAGIAPDTVQLIEAHGTGTPLGDLTEIQALRRVFGGPRKNHYPCAVGAVKSMIGHLIPASGMAGIIKTALALYHKVLPPTLCDKPNASLELETTPFYINTETRPWIQGADTPRRAGVNAFGFGGINAHALFEEHIPVPDSTQINFHDSWDTEVFLFAGDSRESLIQDLKIINDYVLSKNDVNMKDLAFTLNTRAIQRICRLSIIAGAKEELSKKINHAVKLLNDPERARIRDRSGIYYFDRPLGREGKVAFLFPGEGSQYPNMLADLCINFPVVRESFDLIDRAFINHPRGYLPSSIIFPLPLSQGTADGKLWAMDSGAESVFTANMAMLKIMEELKIRPDVLIGHSTGEYSALLASHIIDAADENEFIDFVRGVNRVYEDHAKNGEIAEGILLSVGTSDSEHIKELAAQERSDPVYVAMENCPHQIVLCGSEKAIEQIEGTLRRNGALLERLPFRRAYHTPLFKTICPPLLSFFKTLSVRAPRINTYSCITAKPYPDNEDEIRVLATSQWARRVRFSDSVKAMYADGVRIFIEVGPRGNLTAFVDDILKKQPYLAIPSNLHRRSGTAQLNHMAGLLAAHHVSVDPLFLYRHREPRVLHLDETEQEIAKKEAPRKHARINLTLPRINAECLVGIRVDNHGNGKESALPDAAKSHHPPRHAARSTIMLEHLKTMERFMECQKELMDRYMEAKQQNGRDTRSSRNGGQRVEFILSGMHRAEDLLHVPATKQHVKLSSQGEEAVQTGSEYHWPALPFIRKVISFAPGKQAVSVCELNTEEELFLRDHTLGGRVSETEPALTALPVMPLTFSMEIMAEGASLLMRGKKLTGMREVRAYRWIGLDRGTMSLEIDATVLSASKGEIKVNVRAAGETNGDTGLQGASLIEGIMIFEYDYHVAPSADDFSLKGQRKSRWAGKDLYEGFMFHGPSLRGVDAMNIWGENGAEGTLRALPREGLFQSIRTPDFLIDPVTLDAAGQVIAYWTSDHLEKAFHIFPFRLESLSLFGDALKTPESAICRAKIQLMENNLVRSDIDLIDYAGKVRMRLLGWWDRRFDQPEKYYHLRVSPKKNMLSESWPAGRNGENLPAELSFSVVKEITGDFLFAHDRIWMRVLAHLVLSKRERNYWSSIKGTDKRKAEWLLGRVAAKDAVRMYLMKHDGENGRDLYPADIEIGSDPRGKPLIESLHGTDYRAMPLSLSISHSEGMAFAAVGQSRDGTGIGVDIESVRSLRQGFEKTVFTDRERTLLSSLSESDRGEWILRFWCAKEAVSKAAGLGLMGSPNNIIIKSAEYETGDIHAEFNRKTEKYTSKVTRAEFRVKTVRDNDFIIAVSH